MAQDPSLWVTGTSLGLQALVPIVIGSYKSLKTPEDTKRRLRNAQKGKIPLESDDDEDDGLEEPLTWWDSLLFPVIGSVVLLGFYGIVKYYGTEWLNKFMNAYFSIAGVFAIQSTFSTILSFLLGALGVTSTIYHVRVSSGFRQIFHLPVTLSSLFLIPVAISIPAAYIYFGKPYILSNILALSLSTETLGLLKLDSFATGFMLLGALLVYDVFWVFATPVMVTVAKTIDAPIKILSPKTSPFASPTEFSMLGLGDIVVPGLIIALCLRYDLYRYAQAHKGQNVTPKSKFGRGYFNVAALSYVLGLGVTMAAMGWSGRAQPALLYLSPACTLGPLLYAAVRGELSQLWAYSESSETPEDQKLFDSTIEAASEAAIKARAEAKAAEVEAAVAGDRLDEKVEQKVEEDDSWMNDTAGAGASETKPKKKKGNKKK
ncbi:hypothetical protein I350_05562 [Cryptococcus amylolentus CBS 6273]|uniref:Minor histocompatibility antigen H13 n=1 Tax=Cryptococcus amylolentus CBS 6273 TaxID=1296118 RepID=A0A1E3JVR4_9TREE|nr:hypothetical protein I350_05562 [Cryptococcus amylolentus CBS 6273]